MKYYKKLNQNGLVSIVSTILIILIITVITLSLSTLSRRNLRQALDEQLSTQALYAAESGVNDVIAKLSLIPEINDCSDASQDNINTNRDLGSNVRYTCVLVDKSPPEIEADVYQNILKSYSLNPKSGAISKLEITWKNIDSSANVSFPNCTDANACFNEAGSWGDGLALLRFRLVPDNGSSYTSSNLNNTVDVIAYPGTFNSGTVRTFPANISRKKMLFAECNNTSKSCSIDVTALNFGAPSLPGKFFIQIYSYYKDARVKITAKDISGTTIEFLGAQTTIDSTGASADVLKRIKVNIPMSEANGLPPYVLSTGNSLCKQFITNNNGSSDSSGACNPF